MTLGMWRRNRAQRGDDSHQRHGGKGSCKRGGQIGIPTMGRSMPYHNPLQDDLVTHRLAWSIGDGG